jgi:hypothetical protein
MEWVKIGARYINLANVCEVLVDERLRTARVIFTGGGQADLRDDDAGDLVDLLQRTARMPEEPHRVVFAGTS